MTQNPHISLEQNAASLRSHMEWLDKVLEVRFQLYFNQECVYCDISEIPLPPADQTSVFDKIVKHYGMSLQERLTLLLALAPHICPQILDRFFTKNKLYNRPFTEFGGLKGNYHGGFLPTGETVAFVLAANNLSKRFSVELLFTPDHFFTRYKILSLEKEKSKEPFLSGMLSISREYLNYFTSGVPYKPHYSAEFPAQQIQTQLGWEDLILPPAVQNEVEEILNWIKHQRIILVEWKLGKLIKPGYRSLFYGPPGTGKTLTATLLGKTVGLPVYRVDLSKVVSKYIGETEKNLANVFDQAENKNWILFFDEADALFGKRTANNDSKDRYANQEVAYLLQRIEDFPGLVILATNLKSNIDEAFARRFQSMIYFPMPSREQRMEIWKKTFATLPLDKQVDLVQIADEHEMSGGAIINVLHFCSLNAVKRDPVIVYQEDIIRGIRKEFRKEGKTI